jgi:predicted dehydrogenase
MKTSGKIAVASALAGVALPAVHAAEDNAIRIALVGCGGRGTGAAANALNTRFGPVKLVAMADVFKDRLDRSYNDLQGTHAKQMEVPPERRFIGFEAYKEAIDLLRPGDVAIFATPVAFRWVHFTYAIKKGINVFMEKPITVDGPTTRRMLELGERAKKKNLKVAVGLMCRHCSSRGELYKRIKDGQIGDIVLLRAYRMHGPLGSAFVLPRPQNIPELHYQIRNFHGFLWASGGCFSDFYIHNIDESCWMKEDWPVQAQASGARHFRFRGNYVDQNFDEYSVEYTFKDGTKLYLEGRCMPECHNQFASYAHGTKGSAVISTQGHVPAKCRIYKTQNIDKKSDLTWQFPQPEPDPYQLEWDHLIDAIRNDKPYNEIERGAKASLVTAMGRKAAHTGQIITFDDMLEGKVEFAPDVDKLTLTSEAPLRASSDGKYPVPEPGAKKKKGKTRDEKDEWLEY